MQNINESAEKKAPATVGSSIEVSFSSVGKKSKKSCADEAAIQQLPTTSSDRKRSEGENSIDSLLEKQEDHRSKDGILSPTADVSNDNAVPVVPKNCAAATTNVSSNASVTGSEESIPSSLNVSEDRDDKKNRRSREKNSLSSEEERRKVKRAKNRLSAHQSRLRKKQQLDSLQEQVIILTEENKRLELSRQDLTRKLELAIAENAELRCLQQEAMRLAAAMQLTQGSAGSINRMRFFPPNL